MSPRHAVVVGAGVVGLCSAYELRRQGWEVAVVDKGSADTANCSYGNGGMIVPSHFIPIANPDMLRAGFRMMLDPKSPFGFTLPPALATLIWSSRFLAHAAKAPETQKLQLLKDLNLASRRTYLEIRDREGWDFGLQTTGMLMVCETGRGLEEESHTAEFARGHGLNVRILDQKGLAEMEPEAGYKAEGAVLFEDDAFLEPERFMRLLREKLTEMGCHFHWNFGVDSFVREGHRVKAVRSGNETVEGDAFVLAAGASSGFVAGSLGLRLPILAGKGCGIDLPNPTQKLRTCAILVEARVAITPMSQRIRFVGGMEIGGVDGRFSKLRSRGMVDSVARVLPGIDPEALDSRPKWIGHRPCTPDGLPAIGPTRAAENVVVATGHAMMGMSLGPVTGRLVAQHLTGEKPDIESEHLSPDRFS